MSGNTSDKTTLRGFLETIQAQDGQARRIWAMDRGIPTEEVLRQPLRRVAPGLTLRQGLEKFVRMQRMDVRFPTTDGRTRLFVRYTQPEAFFRDSGNRISDWIMAAGPPSRSPR